ncbi:hypothetical protein [Myroides pelagicus]|uniref:Uncharacterized protein n=1 Tax=Myroides pelagicus TaxID=270914 RepID=A0A7K1GIL9_9FLAO|nr:hypothetical protein [Myroides pelagicus]MEC4112790.1 hypothetical protein [Myroides pelagicus]MTH28600.1 hypothetical protein [Myroides pelagicus]
MQELVTFIEERVVKKDFFEDLVSQIQKDFQTAVDVDIVFTASTPEVLVSQVEGELHRVISSTTVSRFSNLLYRIDVPESDVKSISGVDIQEFVRQITYLIIKREFQKVYIRKTL